MDGNSPHKLSTSALAKSLKVSSQLLFATLKDYGWIRKLEEGWELTSKGEFEGGEYVHSKRYGRYIVWPQELVEHPLLVALEDHSHLSATALGKPHHLSARQVNRALAELGWIKHGFQGWELNPAGEKNGGVQLENDSSGTFYITWPQAITSNKIVEEQLTFASNVITVNDESRGDDLFANNDLLSLDGHQHTTPMRYQVCHWLYMAGVAHACLRRLPVEEVLYADFYLPRYQIYIECWDDSEGSSLAARMQRKDIYQTMGLAVIDVEMDHLPYLDEYLTRQLRRLGIRVY